MSGWLVFFLCVSEFVAGSDASAQERPGNQSDASGHLPLRAFNRVEGRAQVISVKAEGSRVKKGEIVCELDSAHISGLLGSQELVVQAAAAERDGAGLARVAAEIAVAEYLEGSYPAEVSRLQAEVAERDAGVRLAESHSDWTTRMYEKGYATRQEKQAAGLELQKCVFAQQQAQSRREILEKLTKSRVTKQLQSEVAKAKARELKCQAELDLATLRRDAMKRELAACRVEAPQNGTLHLPADLAVGTMVREGGLLFSVESDR
jgi:multidrug resistance efflux pump